MKYCKLDVINSAARAVTATYKEDGITLNTKEDKAKALIKELATEYTMAKTIAMVVCARKELA